MYTIKQRKDIKQYMLFERHHLWRYWNGEEEKDGLSVMINNGGCAPLSRRRSRFSFFFFRVWFDGQIFGLSSSWPLTCRRTGCGLCFACSSKPQKKTTRELSIQTSPRRKWVKDEKKKTERLPNASNPFVFFCLFSGGHSVDGVLALHYFSLGIRLAGYTYELTRKTKSKSLSTVPFNASALGWVIYLWWNRFLPWRKARNSWVCSYPALHGPASDMIYIGGRLILLRLAEPSRRRRCWNYLNVF